MIPSANTRLLSIEIQNDNYVIATLRYDCAAIIKLDKKSSMFLRNTVGQDIYSFILSVLDDLLSMYIFESEIFSFYGECKPNCYHCNGFTIDRFNFCIDVKCMLTNPSPEITGYLRDFNKSDVLKFLVGRYNCWSFAPRFD